MRWRGLGPLIGVWSLLLLGSGDCAKPGWLVEFEETMDAELPRLEESLAGLTATIAALPADVDARLRARIVEAERMVRDVADGIGVLLADERAAVDAALLARIRQLRVEIHVLTAEVAAVVAGTADRIGFAVERLVVDVEGAAQAVLLDLDVQVASVNRVGARTVARVGSLRLAFVGRLIGAGVIALGLVAITVAFIARRGDGPWLPQTITGGVVIGVGVALLVVGELRRDVLQGDVVLGHSPCPAALAGAAGLVGGGAVDEAELPRVIRAVAALLACEAMADDVAVLRRAQVRATELRARMGLGERCVGDVDCGSGRRCAAESGYCVEGCTADAACRAGQLCHPADGRCGPPCAGSSCGRGARCGAEGRCASTAVAGGVDVGRWGVLARCGDAGCLRTLDSALARRMLEARSP